MEVPFYGTYEKQVFPETPKLTEKGSVFRSVSRYLALGLGLLVDERVI